MPCLKTSISWVSFAKDIIKGPKEVILQQNQTKKLLKISNKKFSHSSTKFTTNSYSFCLEKSGRLRGKRFDKIWLIFAGSVIGILNGFFGGGGGMICVPILQKILHIKAKQSHATAIFVILPISMVSAVIYLVKGYITTEPLLATTVGVVAGGCLGAISLKFIKSKWLGIIFAIVMFIGGIRLII